MLKYLAISFVLLMLMIGRPASASAEEELLHTWTPGTVCVENHLGPSWPVAAEVARWDGLRGGPKLITRKNCGLSNYRVIRVTYKSSHSIFDGYSSWWWDANNHFTTATITVNPYQVQHRFKPALQSCLRAHTIAHELGHTLGLPHYPSSHSGSVMSYQGFNIRCGRLSSYDASVYHALYN